MDKTIVGYLDYKLWIYYFNIQIKMI